MQPSENFESPDSLHNIAKRNDLLAEELDIRTARSSSDLKD
jgi:hypothetical protein